MPIEKDATPTINFGFRPTGRPRSWVPEPIQAVGDDGTVYLLTGVVDENGDIVSPASQDDVLVAVGDLAAAVAELTEAVLLQGDSLHTALLPRARRFSSARGAEGAVTNAYAALSVDVPAYAKHLGVVTLWLTNISAATTVTWYLSADPAGNRPLTATRTDTIVGQTAGSGGVARLLEFPVDVLVGSLYAWVVLDAGSARGTLGVTWEE